MDIEMPVMNGLQATKAIRRYEEQSGLESTNSVTIIGVSANARDTFSMQAIQSGMNTYITKPFQRIDITNSVKNKGNKLWENDGSLWDFWSASLSFGGPEVTGTLHDVDGDPPWSYRGPLRQMTGTPRKVRRTWMCLIALLKIR
jgi:two-component SAPR family response regulator